MNTFEAVYTGPDTVIPLATPTNGKIVTFPPDKPGCLNFLLTYTPGVGGRSLNVKLQLGDTSDNFFDVTDNGEVDLTDSAAIQVSIPGGPSKMRLVYESTGPAGADDEITVIIQGFPSGTDFT